MNRLWLVVTLWLWVLLWYSVAHAFDPWPVEERANKGDVKVALSIDNAAILTCPFRKIELGFNPLLALAGFGSPECTAWWVMADGTGICEIRTLDNDYLIGHGFAHCFEGDNHSALWPTLRYDPPSLRRPLVPNTMETGQ